MKNCSLILYFCLIYSLTTYSAYAAPVLYRVQQQKMMKQRQAQEEYQMEYQQYMQHQQQQQQSQPPGQQAAPVQKTYQQMVDERNQSIADAIQNAHQASASEGTVDTQATTSEGTGNMGRQQVSYGMVQRKTAFSGNPAQDQDTVDLAEVWKKLDKRSTVWMALGDDQSKLLTVSEYLDRFHNEGVKINQPPEHYVKMIDQIAQANPQMLQKPFGELLQILAILEYDFDNGMNKDALAKAVLGEEGYEQNKKRFTQQVQQGNGG